MSHIPFTPGKVAPAWRRPPVPSSRVAGVPRSTSGLVEAQTLGPGRQPAPAAVSAQKPVPAQLPSRRVGTSWGPEHPSVSRLSTVFLLCYLSRATWIPYFMGESALSLCAAAMTIILPVAAVYVAVSGLMSFCPWTSLLMACTGASLIGCERFEHVWQRWLGWSLMIFVVGPLHSSPIACQLRLRLWRQVELLIFLIILLSMGWWLTGAPNMGRGDFTGIMFHALMLAPLAALGGITALARALSRPSHYWIILYGMVVVIIFLAASRSSLAAFLIGSLIVITLRLRGNGFAWLAVGFLGLTLAVVPNFWFDLLLQNLPSELTSGFARKSFINTREAHWQARWDEFSTRPLIGVGFCSAWEDSVGFDEETGKVESGSSYLSILSMTGILGLVSFLLLCLRLGLWVRENWARMSPEDRMRICGVAGFWSIHLGAEGYIYGIGSLLGMVFWLWFGALFDEMRELGGAKLVSSLAIDSARWTPATAKRASAINFSATKSIHGSRGGLRGKR